MQRSVSNKNSLEDDFNNAASAITTQAATKLTFNDAFAKTDSAALAQMVSKSPLQQEMAVSAKDAKGQ